MRAGLTPDTRHLKPMLGESFLTSDNVQKKSHFHSKLRGLYYEFQEELGHLRMDTVKGDEFRIIF